VLAGGKVGKVKKWLFIAWAILTAWLLVRTAIVNRHNMLVELLLFQNDRLLEWIYVNHNEYIRSQAEDWAFRQAVDDLRKFKTGMAK
jgi:hypothetical protein